MEHGQKLRLRAALISVLLGAGILALKAMAYRLTGSAALLSDALESIVNVVAAAFALGAIIFAGIPADEGHPFGHGKIEYFSAVFEGVLLCGAGALIVIHGARGLRHPPQLQNLDLGLAINAGAGFINGILGWYLLRTGRRENSKTLEADGKHVLSDFCTTLAILAGLLVVRLTGVPWLDPLIALLMGIFITRTGAQLVRDASDALLDGQDISTITRIVKLANGLRYPEAITFHRLRVVRSGRNRNVNMDIVVPEYLDVRAAHEHVVTFTEKLKALSGIEGEFLTHMDPCERQYCEMCLMSNCPIRERPFTTRVDLSVENAMADEPVLCELLTK